MNRRVSVLIGFARVDENPRIKPGTEPDAAIPICVRSSAPRPESNAKKASRTNRNRPGRFCLYAFQPSISVRSAVARRKASSR